MNKIKIHILNNATSFQKSGGGEYSQLLTSIGNSDLSIVSGVMSV